jgi:hypothetical protein
MTIISGETHSKNHTDNNKTLHWRVQYGVPCDINTTQEKEHSCTNNGVCFSSNTSLFTFVHLITFWRHHIGNKPQLPTQTVMYQREALMLLMWSTSHRRKIKKHRCKHEGNNILFMYLFSASNMFRPLLVHHRGILRWISNRNITKYLINSKRFWRWCIILCGDGFMDFIHRPKSKILKTLKIKITTFRKLALLPSSGDGG